MLEKGAYVSYAACGIPYYIQGLVSGIEGLAALSPRQVVEDRKIDLKLGHEAISIDPEKHQVQVKTKSGTYLKPFDKLLIATGARAQKSNIGLAESARIFTINNLEDAKRLHDFISREKPADCAVIGGGYIAIEMVEAFNEIGLKTHLIHRRDSLTTTFEREISDLVFAEMKKEGVIKLLNEPVVRVDEQDNQALVFTEKNTFAFDLVIVATGVEPVNELALGCGIETGVKAAIRVDKYLQTSIDDIYAAGDCATTKNLITGKETFIPLALKANKEGVAAGINISGGKEAFGGILGSAITKFCGLGIARTGLTLDQAEKNGFEAMKFTVASAGKASYFPGYGVLTAVLIADKNEGRLLGAQLAGPQEAVKRIDVYATAITNKMTIRQLYELDLAYSPPFSPVYDPVVLAGRVGRKKF